MSDNSQGDKDRVIEIGNKLQALGVKEMTTRPLVWVHADSRYNPTVGMTLATALRFLNIKHILIKENGEHEFSPKCDDCGIYPISDNPRQTKNGWCEDCWDKYAGT